MQIPEDEWVLGTYYTFSEPDLEITNKQRREENRLGFAVQSAVLRHPGWPYTHIKSIQIQPYIIYQNKSVPLHLRLVCILNKTRSYFTWTNKYKGHEKNDEDVLRLAHSIRGGTV